MFIKIRLCLFEVGIPNRIQSFIIFPENGNIFSAHQNSKILDMVHCSWCKPPVWIFCMGALHNLTVATFLRCFPSILSFRLGKSCRYTELWLKLYSRLSRFSVRSPKVLQQLMTLFRLCGSAELVLISTSSLTSIGLPMPGLVHSTSSGGSWDERWDEMRWWDEMRSKQPGEGKEMIARYYRMKIYRNQKINLWKSSHYFEWPPPLPLPLPPCHLLSLFSLSPQPSSPSDVLL